MPAKSQCNTQRKASEFVAASASLASPAQEGMKKAMNVRPLLAPSPLLSTSLSTLMKAIP